MKIFHNCSPSISLFVLGVLCFVTLVMCQTRFKISKEVNHEIYPSVLKSKDCWFLYTIGNPDRFKCVLRAFVVVTSPVLSLISTALLLLGKTESNPYFFIPWLFLTIKGLLLVQTDNLITMIRDMGNWTNFVFGFRLEEFKWIVFYTSIFLIDLVEVFSFCEVFDLFLVLWNHNQNTYLKSENLEVMKKEIADIMDALSKCSLGTLSKISLASNTDSEETINSSKKVGSLSKFSYKEEEKVLGDKESYSKGDASLKNIPELEIKNRTQNVSLKSMCEGDATTANAENEVESFSKIPKLIDGGLKKNKSYLKDSTKNVMDSFSLECYS